MAMHAERIRGLWKDYLEDLFKYSLSKPPFLFETPYCGTCFYWNLLNADAMEIIEVIAPNEYEAICRGMEGKIIKAYREDGEIKDTYNEHRFFGFCKRYPPSLMQGNSIIKFNSLLSLKNIKVPMILSGYKFPVMPHDEWCGEWKQGEWVADFMADKAKEKQIE